MPVHAIEIDEEDALLMSRLDAHPYLQEKEPITCLGASSKLTIKVPYQRCTQSASMRFQCSDIVPP
eukprot:1161646-Pelagomonas_calceolata.AAC.8